MRRLVLREASVTTLAGLGLGLSLDAGLGWAMIRLLYQVSPFDPVSFGVASAVLGSASIAATLIPARRAARVSPMTALRDS